MTDCQSQEMKEMGNIVKSHHERREELIDIADKLFLTKGYENTTISDIINEANVAKGTFYHYFNSKEGIMDALIDRYKEKIRTELKNVIENPKLKIEKKFLLLSKFFISNFLKEKEYFLHTTANEKLHQRYHLCLSPIVAEYMEPLFEQGIEEGVFNCKYPKETVLCLIGFNWALEHLVKDPYKDLQQIMLAKIDIAQRLLGTDEEIFKEIMDLWRDKS